MNLTQMMDQLRTYVDARVEGATRIAQGPIIRQGMITSRSPLRVQLEGDPAPVGWAPPCLYPARQGDTVVCVQWGTQLAVLGPIAAGTDTGWVKASVYTPNGFDHYSSTEYGRRRQVGTRVEIGGTLTQTTSGSILNLGMLVGMPAPVTTQLIGQGQWSTGARALLTIGAGQTEIHADSVGSTGTFGPGWVRLSGFYYTDK